MKTKLLFVLALALFFSCSSRNNQKKDAKSEELAALTVEEVQAQGNDLVGKEVVIKGTVTHVCKESGARCFVMGANEDNSIRIEAGKIGSFSQEQMGSDIKVRGILREVKLDSQDLAAMEKSAAEGGSANKEHALGHDGQSMHAVDGGKHDSLTKAKKLAEMSQKLSESKEAYLPVYYLEGVELLAEEK